jgi:hypothetical protein
MHIVQYYLCIKRQLRTYVYVLLLSQQIFLKGTISSENLYQIGTHVQMYIYYASVNGRQVMRNFKDSPKRDRDSSRSSLLVQGLLSRRKCLNCSKEHHCTCTVALTCDLLFSHAEVMGCHPAITARPGALKGLSHQFVLA